MADQFELLCPVVTPFEDADDGVGRVDTNSLTNVVEHLSAKGVDGFVPCGTTGEFAALDVEEFETVVQTTVDAAPSSAPVVAGASATSVGAVRERLRIAADVGSDAALVVAPYYDNAPEPAGNERFFEAALAETSLPVYLYNIPMTVGTSITVETVRSLAERDLVTGIKDTSGDQRYFGQLLRETPADFVVYQGYDAGFVPAVALGADGAVSALAHVIPETLTAAARAVRAGDLAAARRRQIEELGPLFEASADHGFASVTKTILAARGIIAEDTVRPPLAPMADEARETVLAALD